MKEFVDLKGASGASYRFRLVAKKGVPPTRIAGNYAVLKPRRDGFTVVLLGVTTDLSNVREETAGVEGRGPFHTYVRLNVARGAREAEHEDLVSGYGVGGGPGPAEP